MELEYFGLRIANLKDKRQEAEGHDAETGRNGDAVKKKDRGQKTIANLGARSRSDGSAKQVHPTTKLSTCRINLAMARTIRPTDEFSKRRSLSLSSCL